MTVISLSLIEITNQVLALSAMRHVLSAERPPLLHSDHADAIALMIRSAFAQVCMALCPAATDCNIDDDDAEIVSVTLELPRRVNALALRLLIEHAIVMNVLAQAYSGTDESIAGRYEGLYRFAADSLHTIMAADSEFVPRVRPAWY